METKTNTVGFKGKVVDESGEALEGAHVRILDYPSFNGMPYGVLTDAKGDFSISDFNINNYSKVAISYVGKEQITDIVLNLNYKTIVMKDAFTNLPGYTGTYKKKPCWLCISVLTALFGYSVYSK